MEITQIKDIDVYKDGGSVKLSTNIGVFFIDNRIATQTRLELYDAYPDRGELIEDSKTIKEQLLRALEGYQHNFYSPDTIEMIKGYLN